jgi:hypothetical protein
VHQRVGVQIGEGNAALGCAASDGRHKRASPNQQARSASADPGTLARQIW